MTAEEYQKLIAKIRQTEKKYSIPSNTLVGLLAHESANFDDDVLSGKKKSYAGAVGIGQFMNETAKEYKIDPTNIDQSIDAAGRYLQGSFKQLGNTDDAILSYNAGVGGVKAYKAGKPMTKKEHKEYVGKVKAQIVKFGGAFPTPKVGVVVAETEIPQKIYEQQTQYLPISERQDVAKLETGEATDLVADTKRLQKEYSEKEKLFLNDYSNLLASEEQASEIPQKVEKKQQTPTTNYLDIYNQVSDFIDNPLAQQGKRFQLQNERNLIQRDNIPTFKKQDKIKILTEAEKEVRRISEIKARQGEIRQHTPQSTFSRVKEIGLNPLTAAGYAARNEDLPENFSKGSRNTLDYAIDVINPVQYVEDAKNLVQGTARGDLGQVGEGLLGVVPMGLEAKNIYKGVKNIPMGINNLGNKYLPNAYKYNPLAFKANSEAYYRKIGDEGLDDLLDSGVLRSKPNGNFVQEQPYFSKGIPMDGGRAGKFKIPALKMTKYKGKYMAEAKDIPFIDVTGITGQPINTILKDTEGLNIYKEDWLQGYKQVEVPKEELIDLYRIQQGGEVYTQQNYTQDEIDFLNHLGNIPSSKNGLYDFPKQIVKVPTKDGRITMKNIDYSVLGIDEFGNKKVMQPQKEYKFEGKNILEIPLAQEGKTVEQQDQEWLQNWYANRVIPNKEINTEYQKVKNDYEDISHAVPMPIYTGYIPTPDNFSNGRIEGVRTKDNEIKLVSPPNRTTYLHESDHFIDQNAVDYPMQNINLNIVKRNIMPREMVKDPIAMQNYEYLTEPTEVHARLQELRKTAGFRPNQEIKEKDIKIFLKTYKGEIEGINNLLNLTDTPHLIEILNTMAVNNKKENNNVAQQGGQYTNNELAFLKELKLQPI